MEVLGPFRVTSPQYYEYSSADSNKIKKINSILWPELTNVEQSEEIQAVTSPISKKSSKAQKKNQKRKEERELLDQLKKELQDLKLDNEIYHNSNEALKENNKSLKAQLDKLKNISGDSKQIDLEIFQELSELNIQEESSTQAQIQIPPK